MTLTSEDLLRTCLCSGTKEHTPYRKQRNCWLRLNAAYLLKIKAIIYHPIPHSMMLIPIVYGRSIASKSLYLYVAKPNKSIAMSGWMLFFLYLFFLNILLSNQNVSAFYELYSPPFN